MKGLNYIDVYVIIGLHHQPRMVKVVRKLKEKQFLEKKDKTFGKKKDSEFIYRTKCHCKYSPQFQIIRTFLVNKSYKLQSQNSRTLLPCLSGLISKVATKKFLSWCKQYLSRISAHSATIFLFYFQILVFKVFNIAWNFYILISGIEICDQEQFLFFNYNFTTQFSSIIDNCRK